MLVPAPATNCEGGELRRVGAGCIQASGRVEIPRAALGVGLGTNQMEEDDDKRRRNLGTFAVAICSASFFGIELQDLITKALVSPSAIAPWEVYVAGMLINLIVRYVVRDRDKGHSFRLNWPDWGEFYTAFSVGRVDLPTKYSMSH